MLSPGLGGALGSKQVLLGRLAAVLALVIGAGWQVATRMGVTTSLHPVDLALMRYGVPGLLLLPLIWRRGLMPAGLSPRLLALMVAGAGLPFGLLAMSGSVFAPVAHMAVIIPGGMALFVALLAHLVLREPLSPLRLSGLTVLTVALVWQGASGSPQGGNGALIGDGLFLVAALLWAGYTLAFRRSGLPGLAATALVGAWSLLMVVPLWLLHPGSRLLSAPLPDIATQFVWQSLLSGIVAIWAYGVAVRTLGAVATAAIGALVPVLAAVGGALFLGESIGSLLVLALAVAGVFLATGWLERPRR